MQDSVQCQWWPNHLYLHPPDQLCGISGTLMLPQPIPQYTTCLLQDVCRRTEDCETSEEAEYALSIISFIGVCLSLIGLTVTIFTMLFFRQVPHKNHNEKRLKKLCGDDCL